MGYVLHSLAYPMVRLWLATSGQSWRQLPTPSDAPLAHAPGADADRVLLLGSGITVGYGVVSHDLALGGNLARELSVGTGRGASVDIIGRAEIPPAEARAIVSDLDLSRFDALVLTLGGMEALTLMPATRWRRQLRDLLVHVHRLAPALAIFVVETGVPLLDGLPFFVRGVVLRHVRRLNRQSAAVCAEVDGATLVRFDPPPGDVAALAGRTTYRDWADLIAPTVARVLDHVRCRRTETVDEPARLDALRALDLDSVPDGELDRIVETARDLFGATGASVTLVDQELQHTKAAVGMPSGSIPRSLSMCDLTVQRSELFLVEDALVDPRVAALPWAMRKRSRFYAGYPVESPDGQRVGALCVVDTVPRGFSDGDAALLRDLALRVQSVLWGTRTSR